MPELEPVSKLVFDAGIVSDDAGAEEKGSKPAALTAADHKGIPLLAALDDSLVAVLRSGAIKLLRAEFLRADGSEAMLPKLLRRQELERMEKERGIRIFLTPEEAVAALRSLRREVAGLTYGWASPDHPDVTGEYLANVRRFLRHPLGEHVTALFWECAATFDPPQPVAARSGGQRPPAAVGTLLSALTTHDRLAFHLPSAASPPSRKSRGRRPRTSSSPKRSRSAPPPAALLLPTLSPRTHALACPNAFPLLTPP